MHLSRISIDYDGGGAKSVDVLPSITEELAVSERMGAADTDMPTRTL
jgi:hypothetical protein